MTTLKILSHSPHRTSLKLHHLVACTALCSLVCSVIHNSLWAVGSVRVKLHVLHTVPSVSLRSRT